MTAQDPHATDFTISLPTDTASLPAVGEMSAARLAGSHALILADDVTPDEVEALAMSLDEQAGWVGAGQLQLLPGAQLHGPWMIGRELRHDLGLPDWAAWLMTLACPPQRQGGLPPELAGIDPIADAFPLAQPTGTELLALTRLRSIARRLAGAILLEGDGSPTPRRLLIQPDPAAAVDLTVYAPVWLTPDACAATVAPALPQAHIHLAPGGGQARGLDGMPTGEVARLAESLGAEELDAAWRQAQEFAAQEAQQEGGGEDVRAGYVVQGIADAAAHHGVRAVASRVGRRGRHAGRHDVEVRVEAAEWLPIAVRGESWAAQGAVIYQVAWCPPDPGERHATELSRAARREREAVSAQIEEVAAILAQATGGRIVDEDGFLIAL